MKYLVFLVTVSIFALSIVFMALVAFQVDTAAQSYAKYVVEQIK